MVFSIILLIFVEIYSVMCDPELDDKEFITTENFMNFNTKCYLFIKIKDYPVGKNMKCYVWFEGMIERKEVERRVKNSFKLSETYKDYVIAEINVVNSLVTNTRLKDNENFGDIILESVTNVFDGNPKNKGKKKGEFSPSLY